MTITVTHKGAVLIYAPRKEISAGDVASSEPLSAALAGDVDAIVRSLEETGKLPANLPAELKDKMQASLTKYFHDISAKKIQEFADKAAQMVEATLKTMDEDRAGGKTVEVGESPATARTGLTDFIERATGGSIGDVMNMDFFLRIPREVTQGGMKFVAQNWDKTRVDEYPALEFHRLYEREVPRGSEKDPAGPTNAWDDDEGRWVAAAAESGDEDAARVFEETGRMVALKSSDIWQALGDGAGGYDDTLGNPFEPFAFNSGCGTDEVARADAVALGLMAEGDDAEPADVDFATLFDLPEDLEARYASSVPRHALHARAALEKLELQAEEAGHEFHGNQWTKLGTGIALKREGDKAVKDEKTGAVAMRGGKWVTNNGEALPDHAKLLGIPPAWSNVRVAPGPEHDLQAVGYDAKGREQRIYSDAFTQRSADVKFSRVKVLIGKQEKIFNQNESNLQNGSADTKENAAAMKLIQQTGIRPGSDNDTGAEKHAYGATTLEGRHVVSDKDGNVRLRFVGKKGVNLDIPVDDKATAHMLLARKAAAGDSGKLFDTNDAALRDYSHTLNGGTFKPKDFRTLKGTQTAIEEVKAMPEPKTLKDYKKQVMEVAKKVAAKLGNEPRVALQSYISPHVFLGWRGAVGA